MKVAMQLEQEKKLEKSLFLERRNKGWTRMIVMWNEKI